MGSPRYNQLWAKVSLRHLQCAVSAADHGSFRQAAEALNIQQSTLSRLIDQLEHAASIKLFRRSTAGVDISEVGADFIRMARVVLEQINEFSSPIGPSRKQSLRIGFCTSLSVRSLRASLLDCRGRFPQFHLSMLERPRSRLSLKLQNGSLDIVICTGRLASDCKTSALWSERVLIALPEGHPLASREVVRWTDLRSEIVLMSKHDPHWEFEDLLKSKLLSADDRPKIDHQDVSCSILKSLISMRFGIGLVFESDAGPRMPPVVYRELRDGTGSVRVQFSAFWREANDNPALSNFLLILRERYSSLVGTSSAG